MEVKTQVQRAVGRREETEVEGSMKQETQIWGVSRGVRRSVWGQPVFAVPTGEVTVVSPGVILRRTTWTGEDRWGCPEPREGGRTPPPKKKRT